MKTSMNYTLAFLFIMLFAAYASNAQVASAKSKEKPKNSTTPVMKTYVITRDIPNAGKLTAEELKSISQTSCTVLKEMGSSIEWLHSYVTKDQIICIYKAENEELVREHAKKGGFPANTITEVANIISPATAQLSSK
jgi:hypothetical protein